MAFKLVYTQGQEVQENTINAAVIKAVEIMDTTPTVNSVTIIATANPDYVVNVTRA